MTRQRPARRSDHSARFLGVGALASVALASSAATADGPAQFILLPPAEPNFAQTSMHGLSADGTIAVGGIPLPSSYCGFRWTSAEGLVILDNLNDDDDCWGYAYAISADGSTIVGSSDWFEAGISGQAVAWTAEAGIAGLGVIEPMEPDGFAWSVAHGVSADGSTIVGQATVAGGWQAFRWTQQTGMVGLGHVLPGVGHYPFPKSKATAVSADGSIVVGEGTPGGAFRWTEDAGIVQLYPEGGAELESAATDISADGTVIIGWIEQPDGAFDAVRWIDGDQLPLGGLSGYDDCRAQVVSESGEIILGLCRDGYDDFETFVWSSADGMQPLTPLLEAQGAVVPAGLFLSRIDGISSDRRTLAGQTIDPDDLGGGGAFIVQLAAPVVSDPSPDLTRNGLVDVDDLLVMLDQWGACDAAASGSCPADLDSDGHVSVSDLLTLLANWS